MRRRDFITLLSGAAAMWPLAARAQQPVIGYLGQETPERFVSRLRAFRVGLSETGFVEGRNVAIEYRWADGRRDRLPALAAELVGRNVNVLVAPGGTVPGMAAKAATTTIPIVFEMGGDPVATGMVASLNRPGGNLTGVTSLNNEVGPKRLELLRELVAAARVIALLVNPTGTTIESQMKDMESAARTLGLQLHVVRASTEGDIADAFAALAKLRPDGLVLGSDAFFSNRSDVMAALTNSYSIPTMGASRDFASAGGLMSYGGSFLESHHQAGVYTGRVLKGEKPADLPVQQVTKVEFVLNMKTARARGLAVPISLLGRADDVIE